MENEEKSQGSDPEVQKLCEATLLKAVPRLLRPLETRGHMIQPRLVHGDMWDGDVSTNTTTDMPVIFDATCIYGHNESKSLLKTTEYSNGHSRACPTKTSATPHGETMRERVLQVLPYF